MVGDDGKPDFRVTDERKRLSVIRNHWCQLCGEPLGRWVFFTGGTEAAKDNAYFEPACHLDCLIYAMQVCPFIVGRIEHADVDKIAAKHEGTSIDVVKEVLAARNPLWVITKAEGWSCFKGNKGTILIKPDVVKKTPPLHPEGMSAKDWKEVYDYLL
jgi:hypothetical protein